MGGNNKKGEKMIYFVNADTKETIPYDDSKIWSKQEVPVDLNKIGLSMVDMKWERFYAISDPNNTTYKRSGIYKILEPQDTPCYLILALMDITSLHYTVTNSKARGYVSKKMLGLITPYKGRYGIGYIWATNCPTSTKHKLITYLVF